MNASAALTKLNACLLDILQWVALSKLKLNSDKTEFVFGSKAHHQKVFSPISVNIIGTLPHPSGIVKNLIVWLDADISFSENVQCVTFNEILEYLTQEVAVHAANVLVSSHLGRCKSVSRLAMCSEYSSMHCHKSSPSMFMSHPS